LPAIRFHYLRHTAATPMLLQWIHPKIASEMLGHASISITLDLYSHVLPNRQKKATPSRTKPSGCATSLGARSARSRPGFRLVLLQAGGHGPRRLGVDLG
jgi:hypothetical protein